MILPHKKVRGMQTRTFFMGEDMEDGMEWVLLRNRQLALDAA